jgi:Leucine-rich repeat (LRR) protein
LRNINTIINNVRRNEIIESLDNIENKLIFPVEKYSNIYNYIKNLYDFDIKEDTERISINNKFFNNYDLKVLAKLPLNNLRILILENNSISQISCLKNCNFNNLLILNLNNNGIEDISVIESVKFNDIQALFLRYNAIKDILVFGKKKLPSLRQLDLRNNYIKDIKVFDSWKNNLESLQSLYITNNDYDKSKCKETLRILKELIEKEY